MIARRARTVTACLTWTLLVLTVCVWPHPHVSAGASRIPHLDKVVHLAMFLVEGALLRAVWRLRVALALGLGLALFSEAVQAAFPALGRSFEVADLLADAGGLALGVRLARSGADG